MSVVTGSPRALSSCRTARTTEVWTAPTPATSSSDISTAPALVALAEAEAQKFLSFNRATERQDGAIPRKYRELVAIGVALTTQCAYCLDVHTRHARAHGVTKEELAEAAFVAAAVRAGGTLAHSLMALRMYDEEPD